MVGGGREEGLKLLTLKGHRGRSQTTFFGDGGGRFQSNVANWNVGEEEKWIIERI